MKMKNLLLSAIVAVVVLTGIVCSTVKTETNPSSVENPENESNFQRKTMRPFRSQQELESYLREIAKKQRARQNKDLQMSSNTANATPASPTMGAKAEKSKSDDGESVTNVQHAGVDEGGIVKVHGDHLVVLRRGRLFTIAVGDNSLNPVSAVDAFAPDINPSGTWYDEMLVAGDTVVVIGYSYQRGGTEIGLFDIDRRGRLSYRSTYHLRSNDYYSSRNYASRLIGNKLIFYTPQYLWLEEENPTKNFPALRKWHKGATESEFRQITAPTRVYRPAQPLESNYGLALHTVTVCNLESRDFNCEATAVFGPAGRVFYVSPKSVYVWMTDWVRAENRNESRSLLYQMPLTGEAPSALQVAGSPVDQFSFLESEDGFLNVLIRADAYGENMWGSEFASGDVALLRVSTSSFSDGGAAAPRRSYRDLPKPEGYTFQNRFIGSYLLYGTGSGWGAPQKNNEVSLYAVRFSGGDVNTLWLKHGVDRIEAMGGDAVIVGTNGNDLLFSPVRLGEKPVVRESYTRKNAAQGELRSHGFFYKPANDESGLLGLPIREGGSPGYKHLINGSASILFLRNDSLQFKELGELESKPDKGTNDKCRASCVDWYGNARPLFLRGRVFALLGYEIVEGNVTSNGIREMRRINYAPSFAVSSR